MRFLRLSCASAVFGFSATVAAAGLVTSSLFVSLAGVFTSGAALEPVTLSGQVHLVTQTYPGDPCSPTDPCRVFVNLADVHGVGLNSGRAYVAIGADVLYPTDPCIPSDPCKAGFVIVPVSTPSDPNVPTNPVMPITFDVALGFDDTGHLLRDATVVSLPGCVRDIGC